MLYIKKGMPPKELYETKTEIEKSEEWKHADGKDTILMRSFFDMLDKQSIRNSLVREQHGLFAYCTRHR